MAASPSAPATAVAPTTRHLLTAAPADPVGQLNMRELIQLRWIAVAGQVATIAIVSLMFRIELPLLPMGLVIGSLVAVNLFSLFTPDVLGEISHGSLLAALLYDVLALAELLYLSGGATNPFVFLFPLQVALGAVMLRPWASWLMVAVTSLCFGVLVKWHLPLVLPGGGIEELFRLHIIGMWICLVLDVALIVVFTTRIQRILRSRDAFLADLRQRAAEEDHIVRMGLLASGAAHELGTPLATLSVILGDWRRMPQFHDDPELAQEIEDMQAQVQRCKRIVTGILLSAGEARGEQPLVTTLRASLDGMAREWRSSRAVGAFEHRIDIADDIGDSFPVVADPALKQVVYNVLDNAFEASPQWVGFWVTARGGLLTVSVGDRGPGFTDAMLANYGKPYQSTKDKPGRGLGLFLVVNVVRKFGGTVSVQNVASGGALVTIEVPLSAFAMEPRDD